MKITIGGMTPDPDMSRDSNAEAILGAHTLEVTNYNYRNKTLMLNFDGKEYIVAASSLVIAIAALYSQDFVSSALR